MIQLATQSNIPLYADAADHNRIRPASRTSQQFQPLPGDTKYFRSEKIRSSMCFCSHRLDKKHSFAALTRLPRECSSFVLLLLLLLLLLPLLLLLLLLLMAPLPTLLLTVTAATAPLFPLMPRVISVLNSWESKSSAEDQDGTREHPVCVRSCGLKLMEFDGWVSDFSVLN